MSFNFFRIFQRRHYGYALHLCVSSSRRRHCFIAHKEILPSMDFVHVGKVRYIANASVPHNSKWSESYLRIWIVLHLWCKSAHPSIFMCACKKNADAHGCCVRSMLKKIGQPRRLCNESIICVLLRLLPLYRCHHSMHFARPQQRMLQINFMQVEFYIFKPFYLLFTNNIWIITIMCNRLQCWWYSFVSCMQINCYALSQCPFLGRSLCLACAHNANGTLS